tara:strand:+ start:622 stop:723 length:102 start_codon:yes stop_codon:yes gene_type:complete
MIIIVDNVIAIKTTSLKIKCKAGRVRGIILSAR